jgi:hypothetical protein
MTELPSLFIGEITPWWQIATGIIAIPAAVVALVGAVQLNQKTKLETRKLQLEILKEEGKEVTQTGPITREELIGSTKALAVGTQDFILRFLVLYLVTSFWSVVSGVVTAVFGALGQIAALISPTLPANLKNSVPVTSVIGAAVTTWCIEIGYVLIFLSLGVPLLRDILTYLKIRPMDLFRRKKAS